MRHIMLSSVACLAVAYFSTTSHKGHDFRNKVTEHKMCFGFLFKFSSGKISHSKNNAAKYYHKWYSYFDVVVGLVWSHDPKSCAGSRVCYW
jgi:hypothetical protein